MSLNNEKICREITEHKIAVFEKNAGLRSGNCSELKSACLQGLALVKTFQIQDMPNETERYRDTTDGLNGHLQRSLLGPLPTIVGSQTNFNATFGLGVKLLCRFRNLDDLSRSWWTRNGATLRKTSKYRIKPNKYLKIRKVEKSDAGEYICWAKNKNGDRQRSINLNVIGNI